MVENALFLSKEEEKFIVQEEDMDKRIESVVRIIQQKVLQFYTQYESLHGIVQNSMNIRSELDKLELCKVKLKQIHELCIKELRDFEKVKNDFKGPSEGLYVQVLKDLSSMVRELEEYLKNLDFTLSLLRTNNSAPDDERIKKGFRMAFDILHSRYNAFIRTDDNLIATLANIKKLSEKN
jgi:hypothetical protein